MIFRKKFCIFTVQCDLTSFGLGLMTNPLRGQFILIVGPFMVMSNL
jgi:hypothetical protein